MTRAIGPEAGVNPVQDPSIAGAVQAIGQLLMENEVVVVAVAGGPCTGKTTYICPEIANSFDSAQVISEDSYCLGKTWSAAQHGTANLQHPEDHNPERMTRDLLNLKSGRAARLPQYDFAQREPLPEVKEVEPTQVVLVEGAYLLQPHLIDLFDLTIFVETSDHGRFIRRLLRSPRQQVQTAADRLREYCEIAYPAYRVQTGSYCTEADVIVTNPYRPAEASARLALKDVDLELAATSKIIDYTHPAMQPAERLQLATDSTGRQLVTYLPDNGEPDRQLELLIPVADYEIDLTKAGYSLS